jgi:hypothetical protein
MTYLQRTLRAQAVVWTLSGVAIIAVPHWVLVTLFKQVPYPDYAYVRVSGAVAIGFSMLAVLISRKVDEVWWWAWACAITDAAVASIAALNALVGRLEGSGVLLWWLFAGVNVALTAGLLLGLGRAGQEKPFT